MTLDPERDLQRIHSLIMSHFVPLENRIVKCENSTGGNRHSKIEDMKKCTMLQLREIAFQIEQKHCIYQRTLARDTKYGSK